MTAFIIPIYLGIMTRRVWVILFTTSLHFVLKKGLKRRKEARLYNRKVYLTVAASCLTEFSNHSAILFFLKHCCRSCAETVDYLHLWRQMSSITKTWFPRNYGSGNTITIALDLARRTSISVPRMLVLFEPVSCHVGKNGSVTRTGRDTNLVGGCSALASNMKQARRLHSPM